MGHPGGGGTCQFGCQAESPVAESPDDWEGSNRNQAAA